MEMEETACYVEDPKAKGIQGRILEGEGQNQLSVSEGSLVANWGWIRKNEATSPAQRLRRPLLSLALRRSDPGTGTCWWLWVTQSFFRTQSFSPLCSTAHPHAFSSQHLPAHSDGVLLKRRAPQTSSLAG